MIISFLFICFRYSAKGSLNFLVKKKEYLSNLNCKEFKSFADYFQFCLEENLMKDFNIKGYNFYT